MSTLEKNWHESNFVKIGNVNVLPIPKHIMEAPEVIWDSIIPKEYGKFWFSRPYAKLKTYACEDGGNYLNGLDIPNLNFKIATFMLMDFPGLAWHTDSARHSVLNIGLQNSNCCFIEFEDGSKFTMEDGDIYWLNVTKKHRVVYYKDRNESRIILSVNLNGDSDSINSINTVETLYSYVNRLNK